MIGLTKVDLPVISLYELYSNCSHFICFILLAPDGKYSSNRSYLNIIVCNDLAKVDPGFFGLISTVLPNVLYGLIFILPRGANLNAVHWCLVLSIWRMRPNRIHYIFFCNFSSFSAPTLIFYEMLLANFEDLILE